MQRYYTLKSGETLKCWYNDLGWVTIMDDQGMDKETLEFDRRSPDPTVEYNGETIHINNFDYTPIDEMVELVNKAKEANDRWQVPKEKILATFMKESDKIGVVMDVEAYDTISTVLGIGFKGSRKNMLRCLMVPFEDRWKKSDWGYKIELRPESEAIAQFTGRETFYFDDLISMIFCERVNFELVNREKYRESHPIEIEENQKVSTSIF